MTKKQFNVKPRSPSPVSESLAQLIENAVEARGESVPGQRSVIQLPPPLIRPVSPASSDSSAPEVQTVPAPRVEERALTESVAKLHPSTSEETRASGTSFEAPSTAPESTSERANEVSEVGEVQAVISPAEPGAHEDTRYPGPSVAEVNSATASPPLSPAREILRRLLSTPPRIRLSDKATRTPLRAHPSLPTRSGWPPKMLAHNKLRDLQAHHRARQLPRSSFVNR